MAIFNGSKDVTLVSGDSFAGGQVVKFTVLTEAVIADSDGNAFGTYAAGTSYGGVFPRGNFSLASGSIKIWV